MTTGNTGRYSAVLQETQPRVEERRPEPSNAPPRELAPAVPVAITHGKWKLSLSPMAALVALMIAAFFGLGWLVSGARKAVSDPSRILLDVREQIAEEKQANANFQSALIHRFEGLETQVSRLQDSQDRLRERVNDRLNSRP